MRTALYAWGLLVVLWPVLVVAESPPSAGDRMHKIEQELERLRDENSALRGAVRELQTELGDLKHQETAPAQEAAQKAVMDSNIESKVDETLNSYWGTHRFLLTGYGYAQYHWADRGTANSFSAEAEPLLLFRVSDRLLFEVGTEFELPEDGETEVNLEFGQVDYLLNDYATIVGGKFLLPFGEFYERLEPAWINKFATTPLPYRHEVGLLPFNDVGVQVRGGAALAPDGVDLDYSVFVGNGPKYAQDGVAGATLEASNNVDFNKNKAVGARIGLRPLPFSRDLGRWRIGASTYDGTWDENDDHWLYTWGLDSVYQKGPWELRGEYLNLQRNLAGGTRPEHREGWYVQAARKLNSIDLPIIRRSEVAFRYAHQNQPANPDVTLPDFVRGDQCSFGYDYWLLPSTVLKLEYDYDDIRGQPNLHELFTQFAVGF